MPGCSLTVSSKQTGGKLVLALLLVDQGEKISWLGQLCIQPAGGFELRLRFVAAAQIVQNSPAIEMGDTGLRSKADRLAGLCQRRGQVITIGERKRQVQMGCSQIGRQIHDLAEGARSLR